MTYTVKFEDQNLLKGDIAYNFEKILNLPRGSEADNETMIRQLDSVEVKSNFLKIVGWIITNLQASDKLPDYGWKPRSMGSKKKHSNDWVFYYAKKHDRYPKNNLVYNNYYHKALYDYTYVMGIENLGDRDTLWGFAEYLENENVHIPFTDCFVALGKFEQYHSVSGILRYMTQYYQGKIVPVMIKDRPEVQ